MDNTYNTEGSNAITLKNVEQELLKCITKEETDRILSMIIYVIKHENIRKAFKKNLQDIINIK